MNATWTKIHSLGLVLLLVACFVVGANVAWFDQARTVWFWQLGLLSAFVVMAGLASTGRITGFMIDSRNRMSLSRLQLVLWTVVLLSAYLTAVLARIPTDQSALAVALGPTHWWLLGISTTSLIGTPLILSNKKQKSPDSTERNETLKKIAAMEGVSDRNEAQLQDRFANSQGLVLHNESPEQAQFHNLFTGDETGNGGYLDLGKVQMLFFTLILVFAYVATLASGFSDLVDTGEFPELDESMLALLGISHAGYLGFKAAPHSRTEQSGSGSTASNGVGRGTSVPLEDVKKTKKG